jgi:hypothetical protein
MADSSFGLSKSHIQDAIETGANRLASLQEADGSFPSLSTDNSPMKGGRTVQTTFFTSLILLALSDIPASGAVIACKQKAARFLLSQKSEHMSWNYWARDSKDAKRFPYPDDLDDTFCALAALYKYDKSLIDGSVLAKVVTLLTATEQQEGGPYYTWLVEPSAPSVWKDTDLAVNANVAYFLSLIDVHLPKVQVFLEQQIQKEKLHSPYYASVYPIIYFISRFYKGQKKQTLQKVLLSLRDKNGVWENSLNTALAVSALIRLDYPSKYLFQSIAYLLKSQSKGIWEAYPFVSERVKKDYTEFGGSGALTTALCIESLDLYKKAAYRKIKRINTNILDKEHMYEEIMQQVGKRYASLDIRLQEKAKELIHILIQKDASKQIPMLPYYFASYLPEKAQKKLSSDLLVKLGAANVFGWIAYTIFDDFYDEDVNERHILSLATVSLREVTNIFTTILPKESQFQTHFTRIMDGIDNANAWEVTHCRFDPRKTPLNKLTIPNYGDYTFIAEKSFGHCLGPVVMMHALGYKDESMEMKQLIAFFTHFLTAKQLNDDAHDWEKDLRRGQLNPVSALLIKQWKAKHRNKSNRSIDAILPKLQEHFWTNTIVDICDIINDQTEQAREAIGALKIIKDKSLADTLLKPIEKATEKALVERKKMLEFLESYMVAS